MFYKQFLNQRAVYALLAIATGFVLSWMGLIDAQDHLAQSGILLAGIGDIDSVASLVNDQGRAFKEFVERNDNKIKSLESDLINVMKKANRPNMGGSAFGNSDIEEAKSDLAGYIRSRGEKKSMHSGSGPDGGWVVNPVLADGIGSIVRNQSALRELVNFIPIPTGDAYDEVISVTPVGAKWVGEREARPGTDTPKLVKISTVLNEEYAEPVLSQRMADDSSTAMVDFLVTESSMSFAEAEELALFYGTGVNQPLGLDAIATAATADATRPFGTIEHIPTGVSGDFAATSPADAVKKVFYRLRAGYRKNAKWVMNSETALELSNLKDGSGNYLWTEGNVKDGTPTTLLGKPVVICETAPGIAANAKAVWFGDWDQAMRGIERPGNKVLLDPYSDKPNLIVYIYRRMGLQLRNSNAVKCLKFSAS